MPPSLHAAIGKALFVLSLTLAFNAPALADPGPYDMGHGNPYCRQPGHLHGWQGSPYCPHAQGGIGPGAMGGKTLGVLVSDLPNAMLDAANIDHGISVERVQPGSAAAVAGIRAGDLIVEFAGKPVYSAERLRWLVGKAESGKALEIKLLREGQPVTVNAILGDPDPAQRCPNPDKPRHST